MDKIMNFQIPHIHEQIFENLETDHLIQCLNVSQTWRVLAGNVLLKAWKGKMFQACQKGMTDIVQLLLENCNSEESGLNFKDKYGWTPFMEACLRGHKDVVKLLLDHSEGNIDQNSRTYSAELTAFMAACLKGHRDIVELLLGHSGIDFNARSDSGRTAFMMACENGHTEVVQLMLEHHSKIDIDTKGPQGWTALEFATKNGHHDVAQLILSHKRRSNFEFRILLGCTLFVVGFAFILESVLLCMYSW